MTKQEKLLRQKKSILLFQSHNNEINAWILKYNQALNKIWKNKINKCRDDLILVDFGLREKTINSNNWIYELSSLNKKVVYPSYK
jgi:hypothetical protein